MLWGYTIHFHVYWVVCWENIAYITIFNILTILSQNLGSIQLEELLRI